MVGTEGRDGELSKLGGVLKRAARVGLLASPDPDSPGHEYGVWGKACLTGGDAASLLVLEELAVECAGVATCVHVAGLGSLEQAGAKGTPSPAAVALFSGEWRPDWSALDEPPAGAPVLAEGRLTGVASFVYTPPGTESYVVYAAGATGWERVLVRVDGAGVSAREVGQRTGLSAVDVNHLAFEDVQIQQSRRLGPDAPHGYLRRLMLGLCAIAVGNARGALQAAVQYAGERYQGGAQIEVHPAVQLLLGDSRSRIATAGGCLADAARFQGHTSVALWHALAAKLRVTLECDQAVSDCLQVLGGYGYMEDYRLEKRLRDAMTLKAMAIEPNTLRLLCAANPGGDA